MQPQRFRPADPSLNGFQCFDTDELHLFQSYPATLNERVPFLFVIRSTVGCTIFLSLIFLFVVDFRIWVEILVSGIRISGFESKFGFQGNGFQDLNLNLDM